MPEPPVAPAVQRAADYETWITAVRPAFENAAATGQTFTAYEIAHANDLPEPPDHHQCGRRLNLLRAEGSIRHAGWTSSPPPPTHASGVRTWRGTRAAISGRAA